MKTKRDIAGQLKRLIGNTGLDLNANHNAAYGGWSLELEDHDDISAYRMKNGDFYIMLNSMNRLIETMRQEKKSIS